MGGGPFPKFCRGGPCICEGPVGAITADSVEIPQYARSHIFQIFRIKFRAKFKYVK